MHCTGPFTLNGTRSNAKTTFFLAVYEKNFSHKIYIALFKDSFCSHVAFRDPFLCLCDPKGFFVHSRKGLARCDVAIGASLNGFRVRYSRTCFKRPPYLLSKFRCKIQVALQCSGLILQVLLEFIFTCIIRYMM